MRHMNVFVDLKKKKRILFGVTQVMNDRLPYFLEWHVKIKRCFCFQLLLNPLNVFEGGIQI